MFREIKKDQIPVGALILDTTFVLAERENEHGRAVHKARLCVQDFAKGVRRSDVFAPSSSQITSKVVDAKIEEDSLVSVTFDVTAAYPQLVVPEVVVIRPPKEWKQMQLERNQDADVYWLCSDFYLAGE